MSKEEMIPAEDEITAAYDRIEELESELQLARLKNAVTYGTSHPEMYKTELDICKEERDLHRNRLASLLFSDYFKPEVTAGMIQEIADEYIDALDKRDQLREQVMMLRGVLKEIRDDFDCDSDAHKYGSSCRCCIAEKALAATEPKP